MNQLPRIERRSSVCPHDCPSTCSLEVEVLDGRSIGRVYGSVANTYTAGVICAKVARYAERYRAAQVERVARIDLDLLVGIDRARDILLGNTRQFAVPRPDS